MPARPSRPARTFLPAVGSLVLLGGALTGCGGGNDDLVRTAVEALPTAAYDEFQIMVGDVERATELGELERPSDPDDEEALAAWIEGLGGLDGDADLGLFVPEVLGGSSAMQQTMVAEELGTWLGDVRWFGELRTPPGRVSVVEGDIDAEHLDATYAGETDGDGGRWTVGEGRDLSTDLDGATPVRPLGQPLHVDVDGDRLTASFSEPDLEAAVAGDRGDAAALDLADALDEHEVYAAHIVVGALDGGPSSMPAAFDAVGLGLTGQDGDEEVVVVYAHDDEAAAERNAGAVADVVDADPTAPPVEVTGTEVDGSVLTVTLRMTGDTPVRTSWRVVASRAAFVSHR